MALRVPPHVPWNIAQTVSRPVIDQLSSSRQSSLARGDEQTIVLNNAALYQDPAVAVARCFDRVTSAPVSQETLKTYRQAQNQYHQHPEAKFAHGDYLDAGPTERRHIEGVVIDRIGKEANRWEEQLHLGNDPEAQIVYGADDESRDRTIAFIRDVADRAGRRALAEAAGVSVRETAILRGERQPTERTLARLKQSASKLARE